MDNGFLLLKKDGTLWQWGTNSLDWNGSQTNWPSVRVFKPQQIGTNSDWKEIFSAPWNNYAQKTDGSVWAVMDWRIGKGELERQTNLDQVVPQTLSRIDEDRMAYVGKDGTLWICDRYLVDKSRWRWEGIGFLQVGKETNWLAVAVNWNYMVALKSDGSLWKWNFPQDSTS